MYGMGYVADQILKQGHEFKWFDGDKDDALQQVAEWEPDVACFSPLASDVQPAIDMAGQIKAAAPDIKTAFGGGHASALPEIVEKPEVDYVIVGPCYGTIDKIINSTRSEVIKGELTTPDNMNPTRREYFDSVPKMGRWHKKMIMTHFGCVYACSYCATHNLRKEYGAKNYAKHWLTRRPIANVIEEAKIFLEYKTTEVSLCDDDMLNGNEIDDWLPEFSKAWKSEIDLPIHGYVTPITVTKVNDKTLEVLADLVCAVEMGIQSSRPETLRLFNRQFQTEEQVKEAVERLDSHGISVKVDLIMGNPVEDPVGDAIESILYAQRILRENTIASVYPLMLFPGTALARMCAEKGIEMNEACEFEFFRGVGSIKFDQDTTKKIRNLTKLGHFFIKNRVDERWIRAMIEMEIDETAARKIAECNYGDSILFYEGESVAENLDEILATANLRY